MQNIKNPFTGYICLRNLPRLSNFHKMNMPMQGAPRWQAQQAQHRASDPFLGSYPDTTPHPPPSTPLLTVNSAHEHWLLALSINCSCLLCLVSLIFLHGCCSYCFMWLTTLVTLLAHTYTHTHSILEGIEIYWDMLHIWIYVLSKKNYKFLYYSRYITILFSRQEAT